MVRYNDNQGVGDIGVGAQKCSYCMLALIFKGIIQKLCLRPSQIFNNE